MNNAVNELVRSLIHKDSLGQCSINELERLVAQYPYFGPAQFLLAQKLKEEHSPLYPRQSQRAILYFQDHLWFDYISREEDISATIAPVKDIETIPETQVATAPVIPEEKIIEPVVEEQPVVSPQPEQFITPLTTDPTDLVPPDETTIAVPDEKIIEPVTASQPDMPEEQDTDTEPDPEEASETETPLPALPNFKIEPIDVKTAPLTFEPYHTVDYFASQGVRFKEEEKPKDRFSQQLKSFTEWLKAMKRLPESPITVPPTTSIDQKVTVMAERSIDDREVVTEAMAEVWEKQGNREKAVGVYQKLSLLDPSKSAYFAAKIEQLKNPVT
jgi:hypothetical protein